MLNNVLWFPIIRMQETPHANNMCSCYFAYQKVLYVYTVWQAVTGLYSYLVDSYYGMDFDILIIK